MVRWTLGRSTLALQLAATLVAVCAFLCLATAAHASCQVITVKTVTGDPTPSPSTRISYVAAPSNGAPVAYEGLVERLSDVLIYDSGAGAACLQSSNVLTLTYSAPLVAPPGIDLFDSAGAAGLAINSQLVVPSVVRITITRAGTAGNFVSGTKGAALRIRNLRANVSTGGSTLNITVQATASASGTLSGALRNVGYIGHTIAAGAGVTAVGVGAQNSGGTLSKTAVLTMSENFADAFRVAGSSSGVAGDPPSGATSLIFDVANTIPPGVTVTFPPAIVTSGLSFAMRYGGSCSGPAPCFAIYDTTANAAGNGTLTLTTAAAPRSGADGSAPAIGVQIAANSGIGTVVLRAFFGPGIDGDAVDDVNSSAVPRYVVAKSLTESPTRAILDGPWFTISPGVPLMALSPSSLAFGSVLVGAGKENVVMLTNDGTQVLDIGSMTVTGDDFRLTSTCPAQVPALSSCVLTVQFAPQAAAVRNGTVTIVSTAVGSPHVLTLAGEGRVTSGTPAITSISPPSALTGSGWTRLVVTGTNFSPNATVLWNGAGLGTTVLSDTQLAAGIPPENLASAGSAVITVLNAPPGGGPSNTLNFRVFTGPVPQKAYLYYLPHLVTGDGFTTRLTLVDLGSANNALTLNYISQDGNLLASSALFIPSGGTLRVDVPAPAGSSAAATQWAVIGADAPLGVHVVVEQRTLAEDVHPANSFGFSECAPASLFAVPAEFEPASDGSVAGRTIGLALANPSPDVVTVQLNLVAGSGSALASHSLSLPAFGQVALDLQKLDAFAAALPPANFVGSVTANAGAAVCALALQDDYGPFLVAPVVKKSR